MAHKKKKKSILTREKAEEILRDGHTHGRPLTKPQIVMFETIAAGKLYKSRRKK